MIVVAIAIVGIVHLFDALAIKSKQAEENAYHNCCMESTGPSIRSWS